MKRLLLTPLVMLFAFAAFAQGSDLSGVFGVYTGKINIAELSAENDASVTIAQGTEESTVNLTLKGMAIAGVSLGDVVVNSVPATKTETGCLFGKLENRQISVRLLFFPITISLSLDGENNRIENGNASLALRVNAMGSDVHATFVSTSSTTGIGRPTNNPTTALTTIYNAAGVSVWQGNAESVATALSSLPRGLYIVNGKKYVKN